MQSLDYVAARSLAEAAFLLNSAPGPVQVLAGGTDLIVQLREGRRKTSLLVDIKSIAEVNQMTYTSDKGLYLGASVPCWRICRDPVVSTTYPGLLDAVALIGGTQIQGRATVGGNLCNASPAADSIPALIVHRAVCLIFGPGGSREVAVEDFCSAPGRNILQPGEFLMALRLPPPPAAFGAAYLRFIPRNEMDIAVVGVGAAVNLDETRTKFLEVRAALGAVAPTPLYVPLVGDWLAGRAVRPETILEAAKIAQAAARPIDDMRGGAVQRKHLIGVLFRRVIEKAIARSAA
jgi:xanthine dehydrogenase FAD-binding subunit